MKKCLRGSVRLAFQDIDRVVFDVFPLSHFASPSSVDQLPRGMGVVSVWRRVDSYFLIALIEIGRFAQFESKLLENSHECVDGIVVDGKSGWPVVLRSARWLPPSRFVTDRPSDAVVKGVFRAGVLILTSNQVRKVSFPLGVQITYSEKGILFPDPRRANVPSVPSG